MLSISSFFNVQSRGAMRSRRRRASWTLETNPAAAKGPQLHAPFVCLLTLALERAQETIHADVVRELAEVVRVGHPRDDLAAESLGAKDDPAVLDADEQIIHGDCLLSSGALERPQEDEFVVPQELVPQDDVGDPSAGREGERSRRR